MGYVLPGVHEPPKAAREHATSTYTQDISLCRFMIMLSFYAVHRDERYLFCDSLHPICHRGSSEWTDGRFPES